MEEVTEIIPESTETTPEKIQNGIYCIKCRSHTDNINEWEKEITTVKGNTRNLSKATCFTCGKKKSVFAPSVKPIEDLVEKPIKVKQIRAKKVDDKLITDGKTSKKVTFDTEKIDKKLFDALLKKYMDKFDLNETSLN